MRRTKRKQKQKPKRRDHRFDDISETASSMSAGPVTFDLEHARAWGWSEAEINALWRKIGPFIYRAGRGALKRHPERYGVNPADPKHLIFVGAIHGHGAWNDARLRKAGLVRLSEVS